MLKAASLLSSTIIGAGIFALPYVFLKAGFLVGIFYLIFFGLVFVLVYLMYAEVILKTKAPHRFFGYVKIYLGEKAAGLAFLTSLVGLVFSLLIYLVLSLSFLNLIFGGGFDNFKIFIFWLVGSLIVFLKINRLSWFDTLANVLFVLIVFLLLFFGLESKLSFNVDLVNLDYLFLPYGAILFSLAGRVAIAELVYFLKTNYKFAVLKIKKAIFLGVFMPVLIYFVFVVAVLKIAPEVSKDAVSSLVNLPDWVLKTIGVFGLLALLTTYTMIGRNIRESLEFDFKFSHLISGGVIFLPLLLYFLGFDNFLRLVGIAGGVFVSLEAIFIVLMWILSKKFFPEKLLISYKWVYLTPVIFLVFVGGIVYSIFIG